MGEAATHRVVGLMSGTSADGIDAALLQIRDDGSRDPSASLLAFHSAPFPREARERILAAAAGEVGSGGLAPLRRDLGAWFAGATLELLDRSGTPAPSVAALGCHGQTLWHLPPRNGARGASLQLLDPAVLAAETGIPVVSDFRSADLAAGGEGAPLVPWPDRVLFSREGEALALQNLGGMGNVTWLPPRGGSEDPMAFDTGPGNALLDVAASRATGGELEMDRDGALAAAGTVDPDLLARLLDHPFLRRRPPRSTGREVFGPELVAMLAGERGLVPGEPAGWRDLMATLAAFTVESVARSLKEWVVPLGVDRMVLTGGGARNPVLVGGIRKALHPLPVQTGADALGMDPQAREAAAFGLLAWAFLQGVPGNVPRCTGASRPTVLGSWTPAPGRPMEGVPW